MTSDGFLPYCCPCPDSSELEGDWFFGEDLLLDFKRDGVVMIYAEDEEREGRWFIAAEPLGASSR